ncbi:MAG: DUF2059 domain-containing protein [Hyphomicrobiales bacterium]|nr:DUF2059 domain-containing protein [Hyphomicrobiales bacterium]
MKLLSISRMLALGALILCAAPALAQTKKPSESHMALARELVSLTQLSKTFDAFVPQLGIRLINNVTRTRPELKKDLDAVLDKVIPELDKEKATLVEKTAEFFAEEIPEPELKAVVTFFKTPAGKLYIDKQPKVIDRMVVVIDDWNRDLSTRLLERVRVEMKKKGHDL